MLLKILHRNRIVAVKEAAYQPPVTTYAYVRRNHARPGLNCYHRQSRQLYHADQKGVDHGAWLFVENSTAQITTPINAIIQRAAHQTAHAFGCSPALSVRKRTGPAISWAILRRSEEMSSRKGSLARSATPTPERSPSIRDGSCHNKQRHTGNYQWVGQDILSAHITVPIARHELVVAVPKRLRFRGFTAGHLEPEVEDLCTMASMDCPSSTTGPQLISISSATCHTWPYWRQA